MAIAVFDIVGIERHSGHRGFSIGAGTAPRMFAFLLLGLGFAGDGRRVF